MDDPTEHFQRQWEDMDPATAEINRLRDEITALRARLDAVEQIGLAFEVDAGEQRERAERAEAALATARRDALEEAAKEAVDILETMQTCSIGTAQDRVSAAIRAHRNGASPFPRN